MFACVRGCFFFVCVCVCVLIVSGCVMLHVLLLFEWCLCVLYVYVCFVRGCLCDVVCSFFGVALLCVSVCGGFNMCVLCLNYGVVVCVFNVLFICACVCLLLSV